MKNKLLVCGMCAAVMVSSAVAEEDPRPEGTHPRPEKSGDGDKGEKGERGGRDGKKGRPHFGPPGDMFKRMDKDGDGNITKEEFFANPRLERLPEDKRGKLFSRLDGNGDGSLSKEEIRDMRKDAEQRAKEEFRTLDTDKSGGLNFAELSEGEFFSRLPEEKRRQIFNRLDTDGNGEITPADKPKRPERPEHPDRPGHPERR